MVAFGNQVRKCKRFVVPTDVNSGQFQGRMPCGEERVKRCLHINPCRARKYPGGRDQIVQQVGLEMVFQQRGNQGVAGRLFGFHAWNMPQNSAL